MVTSSTLDSEPSALSMAGVCPPQLSNCPPVRVQCRRERTGYIGCECLAIWKSRDARSHASGYCCRLCDPSLVISGCNICNVERRVGCSGNPAFYRYAVQPAALEARAQAEQASRNQGRDGFPFDQVSVAFPALQDEVDGDTHRRPSANRAPRAGCLVHHENNTVYTTSIGTGSYSRKTSWQLFR